jgi:hypothetical protein
VTTDRVLTSLVDTDLTRIVNTASYTIAVLSKSSDTTTRGKGKLNENRSADPVHCLSGICIGRNSDIVNRLLALVRCTDTRLWTHGLRGFRRRADTWSVERRATSGLWGSIDSNNPASRYARGHYFGTTDWHTGGGLQKLSLG